MSKNCMAKNGQKYEQDIISIIEYTAAGIEFGIQVVYKWSI